MKMEPEVCQIFGEGRTKGIFQLNNQGNWSKKCQPTSIEEVSDLISIIRPGCTKAMFEGKSMTQHYVDRKNGSEKVTYIHDSLEPILSETYGVLVYQEQAMRIAVELAGFSPEEADDLRKAIGKKKADLMKKVREKFEKGCINTQIVNSEEANEIFGWIEKSARYSFNKSHGVSYAFTAYADAYLKAFYPIVFYRSKMMIAKHGQGAHDKIRELVTDAKYYDIECKMPRMDWYDHEFDVVDEQTIRFGISSIKGLVGVRGDEFMEAIKHGEEALGKSLADFSWPEILLFVSTKTNKSAFEALCTAGFFTTRHTGVNRTKALYEYESFKKIINKKEIEWLQANYEEQKWPNCIVMFESLAPTKKEGGGTNTVGRKEKVLNEVEVLRKPTYPLEDTPAWIAREEITLVGCPLSISKIEASDTSDANTTCKEINDGKSGKGIYVAVNVSRLSNHKIKKEGKNKGKTMAFVSGEDATGTIEMTVFPSEREKYAHMLYEDNNLLVFGEVKNDGKMTVEKIFEL